MALRSATSENTRHHVYGFHLPSFRTRFYILYAGGGHGRNVIRRSLSHPSFFGLFVPCPRLPKATGLHGQSLTNSLCARTVTGTDIDGVCDLFHDCWRVSSSESSSDEYTMPSSLPYAFVVQSDERYF